MPPAHGALPGLSIYERSMAIHHLKVKEGSLKVGQYPKRVEALSGVKVKQVACGRDYVIVSTADPVTSAKAAPVNSYCQRTRTISVCLGQREPGTARALGPVELPHPRNVASVPPRACDADRLRTSSHCRCDARWRSLYLGVEPALSNRQRHSN